MREQLKEFIGYDKGEKVRKELHGVAKEKYVPKHTPDEYFKFMNGNECSFIVNHPQAHNHPWYFCLFTVVSQHVHGDCV